MINKHKKWESLHDHLLTTMYRLRVSPSTIAMLLGRTLYAVHSRAHNIGITSPRKRLTRTEKRIIRKGASNGWTVREIADAIGRGFHTINVFLKREGIDVQRERNLKKNEDFFSDLSLESAYCAGLIASDGNISRQGNSISITLKEQDSEVLYNLKRVTGYEGTVRHYRRNNYSMVSLSFSNARKWAEDLERLYGIHPAKSLTMGPPSDTITGNLALAYIAGLLEGDGSIRRYHVLYLVLSGGSEELVRWVGETLSAEINHRYSWYEQRRKSKVTGKELAPHFYTRFFGRYAADICLRIMSLGVHQMRRKWQTAQAEAIAYGLS